MKKQVIKTETPNQIDYHAATENQYYGVISGTDKGFVIQDDYKEGQFKVVCCDGLTYKNCFTSCFNLELSSLIRDMIGGSFKVYQFDTYQELFAWLASNES